jgi:hypothetical protein
MERKSQLITAMAKSTAPTQRRKFNDCTRPPPIKRNTAMTTMTMRKMFTVELFLDDLASCEVTLHVHESEK